MKIIYYEGGLGDLLMLTCIAREFKKRGEEVGIITYNSSVYANNYDIDWVIPRESRYHRYFQRMVKEENIIDPNYIIKYNWAEDVREPLKEHVLKHMCRKSGITGEIEPRPWFYPKGGWGKFGSVNHRSICFQSSGIGSQGYSPNKEWLVERMREVVAWVSRRFLTVQIGKEYDPKIGCTVNLAGKLDLNELGVVLKRTRLFVGLEGMPMHMARAVDCPSVIIYGGRLKPWQIGYTGNTDIVSTCPEERYKESGCWRRKKCDYIGEGKNRQCMLDIGSDAVIRGVEEMLSRERMMPTEKAWI